jgi:DNA-binding CsgD family transcriptional regulator
MTGETGRSSRQVSSEERADADRGLQALTRRELEILALVATGETSPSIADGLGITHTTVKRHLHNVYRKLGVSNRVQAVNVYHVGDPRGEATPQP